MSKIVKTVNKLYIRYYRLDDSFEETGSKWLHGYEDHRGKYSYRVYSNHMRDSAYDWVDRYDGDLDQAIKYATRLAKIIKCGKKLLERGWEFELVLVREVTHQTTTTLTDNAMATLAVAALDRA